MAHILVVLVFDFCFLSTSQEIGWELGSTLAQSIEKYLAIFLLTVGSGPVLVPPYIIKIIITVTLILNLKKLYRVA